MSRTIRSRLMRLSVALVAAATTTLALAGSALARGPFPLHAVRLGVPVTSSAMGLLVALVAVAAIAVILALVARQQRAALTRGEGLPVTFSQQRQGADAGDQQGRAA